MESRRGEIVMCPFMAVGHAMPMLQLAKDLGHLGFSTTFVFPGKNLMHRALGTPQLEDGSERSNTVRYEAVDFGELEVDGGSECQTSPGLRQVTSTEVDREKAVNEMMTKLQSIGSKLQEEVAASKVRPLCIVLDQLLFSQPMIVDALAGYKLYAFVPFSASSVAAFHYAAATGFKLQGGMQVPGLEFPFLEHDLPVELAWIVDNPPPANRSSGFILNSWEGVEAGAIKALRDTPGCRHPSGTVFSVGPRVTVGSAYFKADGADGICRELLDRQSPSSVLFICFGSWLVPSEEQMEELAAGVEESKVTFLWVLKSGSYTWLEGFQRRTKDRGLVILGWAPQQYILSHAAVGAFVMTSGWNSVMEALVLSPRGVALVAWPMLLDHLPTCRLLVDHLCIAVEVHASVDPHFGLVGRAEVARAVTTAVHADDMRARAMQLGKEALQSIAPGGSSFLQLQAFADSLF